MHYFGIPQTTWSALVYKIFIMALRSKMALDECFEPFSLLQELFGSCLIHIALELLPLTGNAAFLLVA